MLTYNDSVLFDNQTELTVVTWLPLLYLSCPKRMYAYIDGWIETYINEYIDDRQTHGTEQIVTHSISESFRV